MINSPVSDADRAALAAMPPVEGDLKQAFGLAGRNVQYLRVLPTVISHRP